MSAMNHIQPQRTGGAWSRRFDGVSWLRCLSVPRVRQRCHSQTAASDQQRHEGRAKKCMGDAAMVLKLGHGTAQSPEHVDVRRFGGQHHGQGGVGGGAIESGSPQACAR